MTTSRQTSDYASWAAIALLACAILLTLWRAPMAVEAASLTTLATACAALGGAAYFYRTARPREHLAVMCTALMQVLLFSALGAMLSYLLARTDGALWDARLGQWDRMLGLDWLTFVRWVDQSRALTLFLRGAYASLIPQIILLILALGFAKRLAALRSVMLAAILCGIICVVISSFFPAISNPAYFGLTASDFRNVDPWGGYVHLADLQALRDGTFAQFRLSEVEGIITFPSYHAGLSMVTLWGFWISRMTWLRWPGMTLAGATIIATPVDGGHYFVDVFAGMAIAVLSIAVARRAVYWTPVRARLTASPFRHSHAASAR